MRFALWPILLSIGLASAEYQSESFLKDKLKDQSTQIKDYRQNLKKIEQQLFDKNKHYLRSLNFIRDLSAKIGKLELEMNKSQMKIKNQFSQVQELVGLYLISQLEEGRSEEAVLEEQIYLRSLQKKSSILRRNLDNINLLKKRFDEMSVRFSEYQAVEKDLSGLLSDLENQRKNLKVNVRKLSQSKIDLLKKIEQADYSSFKFFRPLKRFQKYRKHKLGVNFYYRRKQSVLAPKAGKVVYSGQLANYGTVIVIEHHHELRSILLGSMVVGVKKGDQVKRGQKLGRLIKKGKKNILYYEIRKKNQVQNTLAMLTL